MGSPMRNESSHITSIFNRLTHYYFSYRASLGFLRCHLGGARHGWFNETVIVQIDTIQTVLSTL